MSRGINEKLFVLFRAKYPFHYAGLIPWRGIIYLDSVGIKSLFVALIPTAHNMTVGAFPALVHINYALVNASVLPLIQCHYDCAPTHSLTVGSPELLTPPPGRFALLRVLEGRLEPPLDAAVATLAFPLSTKSGEIVPS